MSSFINFSITVTILWTKLSRKAQRGNLAGASGVIWPVRSGSLCWIGRVAKRVVPIWLGSQPPAVAMRYNLPQGLVYTPEISADLLPVSGHVVKRRELGRKTRARTRSKSSGENSVVKRRELGRLRRQRREHHPARPAVPAYGPMKSSYKRALHDHQMAHPGRRIDLNQMAEIFRRAYDGSFTGKNILKGFEASGVSPLNRDVFDETDFAPAAVSVPVVVPLADQPRRGCD